MAIAQSRKCYPEEIFRVDLAKASLSPVTNNSPFRLIGCGYFCSLSWHPHKLGSLGLSTLLWPDEHCEGRDWDTVACPDLSGAKQETKQLIKWGLVFSFEVFFIWNKITRRIPCGNLHSCTRIRNSLNSSLGDEARIRHCLKHTGWWKLPDTFHCWLLRPLDAEIHWKKGVRLSFSDVSNRSPNSCQFDLIAVVKAGDA